MPLSLKSRRNTMMYKIQSVPSSVNRPLSVVRTAWRRLAATLSDPNLGAVVVFSAIGFLIAINLILRFPNLSTLIMEYNLF
jgi:hypothetical protein